MKLIIPLMGLVSLLFISCESNELASSATERQQQKNSKTEFLVFGQYYGFCPPTSDCAKVYKIENNKLYEDEVMRVGNAQVAITFRNAPLSDTEYDLAKSLLEKLPNELLTAEQQVFGSPDAYDQGGIVVEITKDGQVKRYYLDNEEEKLPEAMVPFAQEIKKVLSQLK